MFKNNLKIFLISNKIVASVLKINKITLKKLTKPQLLIELNVNISNISYFLIFISNLNLKILSKFKFFFKCI